MTWYGSLREGYATGRLSLGQFEVEVEAWLRAGEPESDLRRAAAAKATNYSVGVTACAASFEQAILSGRWA